MNFGNQVFCEGLHSANYLILKLTEKSLEKLPDDKKNRKCKFPAPIPVLCSAAPSVQCKPNLSTSFLKLPQSAADSESFRLPDEK